MNKPKYQIGDRCCLNCSCVVNEIRDWESYTLYCSNCGEDLNDWYDYFIDEDD